MDLPGYFDYAAATPLDERVLSAMQPFFVDQFYNPSADYGPAREVRKALEEARASVAQAIGAKPVEIVFTAGGTEANNLAVHGVMAQYPNANVVISAVEHDSVRGPANMYEARECAVLPTGILDLEKLVELVDDQTVLVSVMQANNEIGTLQPLRDISRALDEIRKLRQKSGNTLPLLFHTDAAQAGNYLDLHVHRLGIDLMTINGGKIYGPKQSGVLFVRGGVVLKPLMQGGGQERGLRSGTEHVAAHIGFARALSLAQAARGDEARRLSSLQKLFISELKEHVPNAELNGSAKYRLPNNIHITIPGQSNERLLILLDQAGISAAAGSACSASHDEPSHVLAALGKSEDDIRSSLRFSMGRYTTEQDVTHAVRVLSSVLA